MFRNPKAFEKPTKLLSTTDTKYVFNIFKENSSERLKKQNRFFLFMNAFISLKNILSSISNIFFVFKKGIKRFLPIFSLPVNRC